jgi:GMP reductase
MDEGMSGTLGWQAIQGVLLASDINKGEYKRVEGKPILEPIRGRLIEMREDLQSSISFAGGRMPRDRKKVNDVVLRSENTGEHPFM